MNERSTRQPEVTPDASRRFLRHESDRELLAAASAALDHVIVADSLPRSFMLDFARAVGRRFLARPRDFVLPPRADTPAHEH